MASNNEKKKSLIVLEVMCHACNSAIQETITAIIKCFTPLSVINIMKWRWLVVIIPVMKHKQYEEITLNSWSREYCAVWYPSIRNLMPLDWGGKTCLLGGILLLFGIHKCRWVEGNTLHVWCDEYYSLWHSSMLLNWEKYMSFKVMWILW